MCKKCIRVGFNVYIAIMLLLIVQCSGFNKVDISVPELSIHKTIVQEMVRNLFDTLKVHCGVADSLFTFDNMNTMIVKKKDSVVVDSLFSSVDVQQHLGKYRVQFASGPYYSISERDSCLPAYLVDTTVEISGKSIISMSQIHRSNDPGIIFRFTLDDTARGKFTAFTAASINSVVVIMINGKVEVAPKVIEKVESGRFEIHFLDQGDDSDAWVRFAKNRGIQL